MHIAVDLDDVVLDFCGGLRAAMKKEYDVDLKEADIFQFDLHPILDPIIGGSWWGWMRKRDWLWENFPAVDGAIGGLERLRREGHYLECVTAKPEWAEYSVWRWLGKWRPPFNRVTIVDTETPKVGVTDAELLIDDKPENCRSFTDAGRGALLFTRPHNLHDKRLVRVRGWKEVPEWVTIAQTQDLPV